MEETKGTTNVLICAFLTSLVFLDVQEE